MLMTEERIMKTSSSPEDSAARHAARTTVSRPDRLILVYDGDSGAGAMLLDVVKKAVGKEDCALCEITNGPLGKRRAFRACEARLGVIVDELHRDQLPHDWGISRADLPCVLGRVGTERPFVVVSRSEISLCNGQIDALEARLVAALSPRTGGGQ
jgi:hypothetical protein